MLPAEDKSQTAFKVVDDRLLSSLCESARASDRLRSHFNLHDSLEDPFQRMIVAIEPGSYIRPHRHWLTPKPETLFCLRGKMGVVIFDETGQIEQQLLLSPCGEAAGCDIPAGAWHTIVGLQPETAFMEAKPGPYTPFEPEDFAAWAPENDSGAAAGFLLTLQQNFS